MTQSDPLQESGDAAPKTGSLQRRLTLLLTLGITALWLFGIAIATLSFRHELEDILDNTLRDTAQRLLPLAAIATANGTTPEPAPLTTSRPSKDALAYVVRNGAGDVLLRSKGLDIATFPAEAAEGFSDTDLWRTFALKAEDGALLIQVAEPVAERQEALHDTMLALLVPLLILLPTAFFGIAWLIRRSFRPVSGLSAAVQSRSAADLSPLQGGNLPSELAPIRSAINQLLGRLSRALEAERSFTADAAHELRTPIASTLAQTQRLVVEAPAGTLRNRARSIETELKRLAHLSEKLLQLSRAEGGGILAEQPQDPAPVLALVVEDFRRAGHSARLRVSLPHAGATPSRMDPDAFAILARNLIENALKHGDPNGPVDVVLLADGTLIVSNGGKPVPPDQLSRLTNRFERAGARKAGAGLGLAIAASIAAGAGASLTLTSPAPARKDGFEARLDPTA